MNATVLFAGFSSSRNDWVVNCCCLLVAGSVLFGPLAFFVLLALLFRRRSKKPSRPNTTSDTNQP